MFESIAFSKKELRLLEQAMQKHLDPQILALRKTPRTVLQKMEGNPSLLHALLKPLEDINLTERLVGSNLSKAKHWYAEVHRQQKRRVKVISNYDMTNAGSVFPLLYTSDHWEARSSQSIPRDKKLTVRLARCTTTCGGMSLASTPSRRSMDSELRS